MDTALLWLWCRLAAAALIQPLARELPYAVGAALKRHTHKKKEKKFGDLTVVTYLLRVATVMPKKRRKKKTFNKMYCYLGLSY